MYQINAIDDFDVTEFTDTFQLKETTAPDAVLVRSSVVPDSLITNHLLLVARSGIGTNTINIDACTKNGTAVFNTPGANANAVKELVLQSLFASVWPLQAAIDATAELSGDQLQAKAEATRHQFVGGELYGKTVGIIGLGAIGQRLANSCYHLGMQVIGYNRSPKNLQHVQQLETIEEVLQLADFVVLLLPLSGGTRHIMAAKQFREMRENATLLNFGRGELVDQDALLTALKQGQFHHYVTDFPHRDLQHNSAVTILPHLGGNTIEALSNSANITLQNTRDFLEAGTIRSSVNFPTADLPFTSPQRLTFFYEDRPTFWADVTAVLNQFGLPILEMMSNTRDTVGYTIVNTNLIEHHLTINQRTELQQALSALPGMIRLRMLDNPSELLPVLELQP